MGDIADTRGAEHQSGEHFGVVVLGADAGRYAVGAAIFGALVHFGSAQSFSGGFVCAQDTGCVCRDYPDVSKLLCGAAGVDTSDGMDDGWHSSDTSDVCPVGKKMRAPRMM